MKKTIEQAQKYLKWQKPNQAIAELRPLLRNHNSTPEYAWIPNHMMGIALSQKGEHQSSAKYLEKAIKKGSIEPETYHMLSVNYYNLGQFEKAEQYGKEAVGRKDDFLKAWLNLGSVYRSQAKLDEALKCYQKANQLDPKNAGVAYRIGEIYRNQGNIKQAIKLFKITLKIEENHLKALLAVAVIYKEKGKFEKALTYLEQARKYHSDLIIIGVNEAEIYKSVGDYDQAIKLYEKLVEKKPNDGALRVNYALCLQEVSRFDESEKHYRQAIEDTNGNYGAISNYLMGLHYNPENSKEHIFKEHLRLGKKFVPQDKSERAFPDSKTRNKRLKIGFVSGGFRRHPVGWMIAGALEQLPEDRFELYCYTTNNKFDFVTRRIHQNIDVWRSVVGYNSDVIERIIREDKLDILVDLSGHSADNCLEVMAREPAPIIVKWVGGLFNTTGLEVFDYLISDWHESPEGEESYYTEKLVRLPDDYITFTPPAYAPEIGGLPAEKNGYVTFGCFNNPTKVNDKVLKQWAEIMQKVSDSRLFLKSKQYDTTSFRDQITGVMKKHGISSDRIEFQGHTSHDEHLGAYNRIDIALDPWPYSGGLTTCEALYMGVPVITMPGPTFAGRHSTTHLINAGLEQWVTNSWEEYTEKVVALAKDRDMLQGMRERLREQILHSPVCNGKRFGAHLSVAFQKIWEQWVDGYENEVEEWQDHIEVELLSQEEIEKLTNGPDTTPLITVKDEDDTNPVVKEESNKTPSDDIQQPIATEEMMTQVPQQATPKRNGQEQNKTYYIETKDDVTICTPADLEVLTPYVLLEQEQWLEPELDFIRQYLQPGMQVVDVGASFGAYALPMAKKVGGKGAVYAFEPGAVASQYLEMSKSENGFNQLEVIERGLGQEIGKGRLKKAESPELNTIDDEGEEEVNLTTLDAWWDFAGQPEIDLVKIDVNGMEPEVLQGARKTVGAADPVILASIGENEESLDVLREQLTKMGYVLFEYIPGPGLLAGHEPEAGVDPYLMNIVAIKENRIKEFKEAGWIFDETATPEKPESTLWKETLSTLPWTDPLMDDWEEKVASGAHEEYMQALNMICAAEQMEVSADDAQLRSCKGATMLAAAQKLIGLFNSGKAGISAAMTYVRVMTQLGKQGQTVEMMKELMETVNSGNEVQALLPFLPPLPEQDNTDIQTEFSKWLTVRIVEAWIMLKAPSTYMSGEQEKQMLKALEGNPELNSELCKSIRLLNEENEEVLDVKLNQWFWNASDSNKLSAISVSTNGHSVTQNSLKHLYLGYPGRQGGAHGIHEIRIRRIAREIEKKGIVTTVFSSSEPDFFDALYNVKNNLGYACYSGVMGCDLKIHSDMGVSGNVFDLLDMPVFAFLGDHPYTDFMWSRIVNSADRTVFLTSIPSLKEEMEQIFPNTAVKQIGNLFPLSTQSGDLKSIGNRSVDVLVPWGLHKFFANQKPLAQQLQEIGSRQKDFGMALYDEAVGNYRKSILAIFAELYQAEFGGQYQFGATKTKEDFRWLKVLSLVDWMIRKDRRIKMLREQLSSLPEKYRIVITANEKLAEVIPELKGKNNIEWVGQISKQKLNQYYLNSKVVFNCNPTYLDNIHPRVYEGISNGSFVVSDFNEALETTLFGQNAIGIIGQKSNEKNLLDYLEEDWKKLQEKVDHGREIIGSEFTAENHAQSLIEVITDELK